MHKLHRLNLPRLTIANVSLILLGAITIGLIICTALLGQRVRILWSLHNTDLSTVRGLIKDANENIYHPAVIEPKERQQYIYEASIRFPLAANDYQNFRYLHEPAENGFKEQVFLVTDQSLNAAYSTLGADVFKNVPTYQRCSKEFIIQFASGIGDEPGFTQIAAKALADGRTAFIYKNTGCNSTYKDSAVDIDAQQKIAEAIDSY